MSRVKQVYTLAKLDQILSTNKKVVVSFGAPSWCIPCRRLAPHFAAAADIHTDAVFIEVDIENADQPLLDKFTIKSVPTVLLFIDGVANEVRARTAPQIVNEVSHG